MEQWEPSYTAGENISYKLKNYFILSDNIINKTEMSMSYNSALSPWGYTIEKH